MSGRKYSFILFTFILIMLLKITDLSPQDVIILRWEPVRGAGGYILEIRNSKRTIILEKEISASSYDISKLTPGDYQYRLTTLNKLKRKGSSTEWIPLSIEKAVIPVLLKTSRKFLSHSFANPPLIITGKNFRPDTKLYFKKDSEEIQLNAIFISENELKVIFNTEKQITGIYDIAAVNRGGFDAVLPSSIEIIDPDIPLLESVSRNKIFNSEETGLTIKGKNLKGDIQIFAEDVKGIKLAVKQQNVSDNEIGITLNPGRGNNGNYKITAVKRDYFYSPGKLQIEIADPPLPELESVSLNKIYNTIETKLVIRGKNLGGDVLITAEDGNGVKLPLKQQNVSDTEIVIEVNPAEGSKGIFNITAIKYKYLKSESKIRIEIIDPDVPVMESLSTDEVYQTIETNLVIKGNNLGGDVLLNVENSKGEKLGFIQKSRSDTEIDITIRPGLSEKGEYTISAVKVNQFSSPAKLKFKILDSESIEIVSIIPKAVSISRGKFTLKVNGKNFNEQTVFELHSNGLILKPYKVSVDNQTAFLGFKEKKYQGGEYSLTGEKKPYKTITSEKALTIEDTSKGLLGLNVLAIGAGWDYSIPAGEWSSKIDPSITGFHLYLSYPLSNIYLTKDIPVLKMCGTEAGVSYADYNFSDRTGSEGLTKTSVFAGINYSFTPGFISYNMSMIFNIDAGNAYSSMTILSNGKTADYTSFDTLVKGGLSFRYEWFNYYFTDLSVQYSRIFYVSHPFDEATISFRAGVLL